MRRPVTIAIIVATAAITTAWAVSTLVPGGPGADMRGGGGSVPTHSVASW